MQKKETATVHKRDPSARIELSKEKTSMRKAKVFVLIMAFFAMLASGCSGGTIVFSGGFDKYTIEIDAVDGKYGESFEFGVGKDRIVNVNADLSEGTMKLEFAEATVILGDPDTPEDVIIGNVITTLNLTGQDSSSFTLPEGDYAMLVTAEGKTKGTVKIEVVKP
jgi:hypothetical protein